jgi:hypothetical protein
MFELSLYPKDFNYKEAVHYLRDYEFVFTYAYVFYLPLCQILGSIPFVQSGIVSRKTIKHIGFVWNVILSVFSAIGTYFTLPFLVKCLLQDGLDTTLNLSNVLCDYRYIPSVSYWSTLFVVSKIFELGDTFLYIIKNGKQHIFLHWYHHVFTGVYTYLLTVRGDMPHHLGLWMVSLNYFVHTFMYAYYGIMEITGPECGLRLWAMKNAFFITYIQILQMIIMIFVFFYDKFIIGHTFDHFGFGMYLVYAILFIKLFIGKYKNKND